ncbi:hypothetical protein RhiirA4_483169 [Rhizophagus irregularis]|uniref:DUF8211 domain-containing protein n=1 Tax=Rhizophagus irregularis TaxID=588596 RepID=A0A2I1HM80_9GLOM|nr:hypothetical protein RhiirA4_483169 [Rhizophagus irregularis]
MWACGLHFHCKYENNIVVTNKPTTDTTIAINPSGRKKDFHADLIHQRWRNGDFKRIYSNRTGITYHSRYMVCNSSRPIKANRTYMYQKLVKGLKIIPSANARTAKKQMRCFERSTRRVLDSEIIKPGGILNVSTKLAAAKKKKFLFLGSQRLNLRVSHLKFKKLGSVPDQQDYTYKIPILDQRSRSQSDDMPSTLFSPSPYCPIPDMNIPPHYRDIIPPDPIYDDNDNFIVPDSQEWFIYMFNLSKSRNVRLTTADREKILQDRATYWGTTPKHNLNRARVVDNITTYNNTFHRIMSTHRHWQTSLRTAQKQRANDNIKMEMDNFFNAHPYLILDHHRRNYKLDFETLTSDDTKSVEIRPLKRDTYTTLSVDGPSITAKRSRLDPISASDSKQTGSSRDTTNTN